MENQHRKIKGYRELGQSEIDLMNRIKQQGAQMLELQKELLDRLQFDESSKRHQAVASDEHAPELDRFLNSRAVDWAEQAYFDIENATMKMVRAIAQPAPVEVQLPTPVSE